MDVSVTFSFSKYPFRSPEFLSHQNIHIPETLNLVSFYPGLILIHPEYDLHFCTYVNNFQTKMQKQCMRDGNDRQQKSSIAFLRYLGKNPRTEPTWS